MNGTTVFTLITGIMINLAFKNVQNTITMIYKHTHIKIVISATNEV